MPKELKKYKVLCNCEKCQELRKQWLDLITDAWPLMEKEPKLIWTIHRTNKEFN